MRVDAVEREGWERFVADASAAHGLARTVQAHWAAFARDGAPAPAAEWPPFDTATRATRLLDRTCSLARDPRRAVREVWGG